jgi:hypothetical protein
VSLLAAAPASPVIAGPNAPTVIAKQGTPSAPSIP